VPRFVLVVDPQLPAWSPALGSSICKLGEYVLDMVYLIEGCLYFATLWGRCH